MPSGAHGKARNGHLSRHPDDRRIQIPYAFDLLKHAVSRESAFGTDIMGAPMCPDGESLLQSAAQCVLIPRERRMTHQSVKRLEEWPHPADTTIISGPEASIEADLGRREPCTA